VWLWVNLTHSHVIRRALKRMHLWHFQVFPSTFLKEK
jgi:hypothetical protein